MSFRPAVENQLLQMVHIANFQPQFLKFLSSANWRGFCWLLLKTRNYFSVLLKILWKVFQFKMWFLLPENIRPSLALQRKFLKPIFHELLRMSQRIDRHHNIRNLWYIIFTTFRSFCESILKCFKTFCWNYRSLYTVLYIET